MYNEIGHLKQRKELKRGTVEQRDTNLKSYYRYFAEVGQRVYETRRKNSKKPYKLAKASKFLSYAKEQILKHHMAPDTICGKAKKKEDSLPLFLQKHSIIILIWAFFL